MSSCVLIFSTGSVWSSLGTGSPSTDNSSSDTSESGSCTSTSKQVVKHSCLPICFLGLHYAYLFGVVKYLKVVEECC